MLGSAVVDSFCLTVSMVELLVHVKQHVTPSHATTTEFQRFKKQIVANTLYTAWEFGEQGATAPCVRNLVLELCLNEVC